MNDNDYFKSFFERNYTFSGKHEYYYESYEVHFELPWRKLRENDLCFSDSFKMPP